jgi:hypothetical protein
MNKIVSTQTWAGVLILCLGISCIWGWVSQTPWLVQVKPEFVGMVFNTAFCFMLLGIAFLAPLLPSSLISTAHILRLRLALGGILIVLSSLVLVENLTAIDLGLDARARCIFG